ncbi:hypothetical protein I7X12_11960 [Halosimplex litoreum]|uniref:Uncharacterized protein n=1 Tax=Halosimplex litoreum TaxID=1198301 RepID=A0A7T3FVL6_9EURY|nr:hypothetical protein [Halosimplex litoreum]QPV61481.1 hypothetical protein I7X12_11960 [Halosimplex litoreum]
MDAGETLGTDPVYERRRLAVGVLLGTACSALLGAALPNPGPWYVGGAAQVGLVAVSVALLALGFGVGVVLLVDFALLFPAYYVRAQSVGIGFRTPMEQALPQATMDAALLGIVGVVLWLVVRRVADPADLDRLVGRVRSE